MIDIKDLQIGNKVLYQNKVVEIETIHVRGTVGILNGHKDFIVPVGCKDIEPIEVTGKLLNKIGFYSYTFTTWIKTTWFILGLNEVNIKIDNYPTCKNKRWSCQIDDDEELLGSFDFNYLHELQNGIRLITKGDLEVCL